jgi:thiol-disulfide isomerase/thioredoxin
MTASVLPPPFLTPYLTDPEAAFAQAAASGRPLLLYWGARWCPPCNRLQALVFPRPDFSALAPHVVLLHVDGDSVNGQQIGARLQLRSYPTLVLYQSDGAEMLRVPPELAPDRLTQMLHALLVPPDLPDPLDAFNALRQRVNEPGIAALARAGVHALLGAATDPARRHVLVNSAANLYRDLGLDAEAEALILDALPASHAPYYFMHALAEIAQKRGDAREALDWYERAWLAAEGPATRLQWGATFLVALSGLAPQERARIEALATQLLSEAGSAPAQRDLTQVERIQAVLAAM